MSLSITMTSSALSRLKPAPLIILAFLQFATLSFAASTEQTFFSNSSAQSILPQQHEFLPVDQAFQLSAEQNGDTIRIFWQIAPDYYLYKHRLQFERIDATANLSPEVPKGKEKNDEYFGDVEVYYDSLAITLPNAARHLTETAPILRVSYQGCADAGLCYPPQNRYLHLEQSGLRIEKETPTSDILAVADSPTNITEEQRFTALLTESSLIRIVGLFLIAGLALTFTPCVLPMVPIISSIVMGQDRQPTRRRAFALSLTYVLAMASTYAIAGTITGYFGAELNLQMKLQSPWILSFIALLFVLFALAMFDVYQLRLPNSLQSRLHQISHQQQGGNYIGVAIIGVISSLIISPCVSAPLAGALVYISSTGDPVLGGLALLALGLGMGIPLLAIGTLGVDILPKAGKWMNQVKVFFGVLLLGVAIWMLERLLPVPIILALTMTLLVGYAIYLKAFQAIFAFKITQFSQLVGIVLLGYGLILTAGAIQGGYNPFTPIDNLNTSKHQTVRLVRDRFISISNISEFDTQLAQAQKNNQLVMLDIYADWCVSCRIIEQDVFSDPKISTALQPFVLLRADITKNSRTNQSLLDHFGLFGPPGLLFFLPSSGELRSHRIQGEITANQLKEHLDAITKEAEDQKLALNETLF
ncbi:MAG: protein-disulfide reductase DsbD [Pseudomonadales bacterium]|nr:protein-disulfide reductase DsbD [Pseudomonadales bacterium]